MPSIKERKTFTLSRESTQFLASECRLRKAPSTSAVLDQILREQRQRRERSKLDAAVTSYYDSLSEQAAKESSLWGELAEIEFREVE